MKYEVISNTAHYECKCGHCNSHVSLNLIASFRGDNHLTGGKFLYYHVGQCPNCGLPLIVDTLNNIVIPPSKEFDDISNLQLVPDVKSLYEECRSAYSVGAYTCCILAARKILMHIAVSFGSEEGRQFIEYVDYLVTNHYTPPRSKTWVDKIRQFGNEANHEIIIGDQTKARNVITFVSALLRFAYEYTDEEQFVK